MKTRINPFAEIEQFFNQLSRQFEDTSQEFESVEPFGRLMLRQSSFPLDVIETEDALVVSAELPGFERDDIEVHVTDGRLRIEAERDETVEEEDVRYIRRERQRRAVTRSIELPIEFDNGEIEARMKNGVLTVTCPKVASEASQEIEIEIE